MTLTLTHEETVRGVQRQDPPIRKGDHWQIAEDDGTVVLELRVVCRYFTEYPDGKMAVNNGTGYIVMERCGGTMRRDSEQFEMSRVPEYNLRRLFKRVEP